jgi:hypothetical protein
MNYWLDLFTGTTWKEFRDAGSRVSGFRRRMRNVAGEVRPGDVFLCYLTGVMRWIGALEVVSGPKEDHTPIWKDQDFPIRFEVRPIIQLDPEYGVPMDDLQGRVLFFAGPEDKGKFKGFVRKSPNRFKRAEDGSVILELLRQAEQRPVQRAVDPKKLARKPLYAAELRKGKTTIPTVVSVPEPEETHVTALAQPGALEDEASTTRHTEMQFHLLHLGAEMGLDVWVAKNDRSQVWKGTKLGAMPRVLDELPTQFNEATNRTIQLIDVLWLRGNSIVAAFEVECTTAIYSGLLRMSDLLALQPNGVPHEKWTRG